jgi:hypothetical protein
MIAIRDIVEGVAAHSGWDGERADLASRNYLRFLASAGGEALNEDIDAIWHEHILHTKRYREDCEALAGGFVDHFPAQGGVNGRLASCGANGPGGK